MSSTSTIEWTDASWNPVRGCTKISPGCKNCYVKTFAERWRGIPGHAYEQGFDLRLVPEHLTDPLRWLEPKTIFVNSMSDLFHEGVPDDYIVKICEVMLVADWHIYQVLTKRPVRMAHLLKGPLKAVAGGVRKKLAGRLLDGRTYDEFPEIQTAWVPTPKRRRDLLEHLSLA